MEKPKKCEERSAPASTSGAHWMSAAIREKLGLADYDLVRTAGVLRRGSDAARAVLQQVSAALQDIPPSRAHFRRLFNM